MKKLLIFTFFCLAWQITIAQTVVVTVSPTGPFAPNEADQSITITATFYTEFDDYPCTYTFEVWDDATMIDDFVIASSEFTKEVEITVDPGSGTTFYDFRCVLKYSSDFFGGCSDDGFLIEDVKRIEIDNPPSVPTGLAGSNITGNSFTLSWSASTDPEGDPITYQVYKNGTAYGSPVSNTSRSITSLSACTSYNMTVKAIDGHGKSSAASSIKIVTTLCNAPPSVPANLTSSNLTNSSFTLSWSASTDPDGDPITYQVYKDGVAYSSATSATTLSITGLSTCTTYNMTVKALDNKGNTSASSSNLPVTTGCCPTNLTLTSPANNVSSGTWDFKASNTIIASNVMTGTSDVHMGAPNSVRLVTGFKVAAGSKFKGNLLGCSALKSTKSEEKMDELPKELSNNIYFYPNPSDGLITLNFDGIEGKKNIIVFNMFGSVIHQTESSDNEFNLDLSSLPKGVYIIKVVHSQGKYQNKLIIK